MRALTVVNIVASAQFIAFSSAQPGSASSAGPDLAATSTATSTALTDNFLSLAAETIPTATPPPPPNTEIDSHEESISLPDTTPESSDTTPVSNFRPELHRCYIFCSEYTSLCMNLRYSTFTSDNSILVIISDAIGVIQEHIERYGVGSTGIKDFYWPKSGPNLRITNTTHGRTNWGVILEEIVLLWDSMIKYGFGKAVFFIFAKSDSMVMCEIAKGSIG
ncbi:hypothetical protein MMC24_001321 [Lignoscripta atroalba]|nr:hypothetical protein [Lignoscripta atroalba]